ncbi:hypothetical protein [Amycolatopsis sp. cmx-8-4]|uniref:hypothetical protein n=1 Tax=Amycolatopsis sp. cmx-8-4 TaxID=2790947 RepID=UPI00397BFCD5
MAVKSAVVTASVAPSANMNGNLADRTCDGVGTIFGGNGNRRLLIGYSEPRRGQILDYISKPGYSAAVQSL